MYLDKDISHACPNELFRRRIEELDTELKKYDEHVTSFKQMDFSSITIPQTWNKGEVELKQDCYEAAKKSGSPKGVSTMGESNSQTNTYKPATW